MNSYFSNIPTATRTLLITTILVFLLQQVMPMLGYYGALYYVMDSYNFHFWQPLTYMFLHGSFSHLLFNMFGLWMFGMVIERTLGTQRFVIYYFVCGIGAALCQEVWQTAQLFLFHSGSLAPTIGASGAVYGILLAFGMLYPNERIMLLIPPIPMKAKYFVIGFIALEVISLGASDNVAHFAHLGGILFGWGLIRYWRKKAEQHRWGGGWQTKKQKKSWKDMWQRAGAQAEAPNHMHTVGGTQYHDYIAEEAAKKAQKAIREKRIGEILDKVKSSGYESLTKEEKDFLFDNSH